jgi:hypothetical protein
MHAPSRRIRWYAPALLGVLLFPAQSQAQSTLDRLRSVTWSAVPPGINRLGVKNFSAPAGAHLNYYGGRVVSNMQVVMVLWGSGSYESHVTSTSTPSMLTFYQQVLSNGSYSAWLNREYNTVGQGSNQIIGPGSVVAQFTITPSVISNTVSDAQIQAELASQIAASAHFSYK